MNEYSLAKVQYYHYYDYPAIHMVRRHDGVSDGRYKLIHFYGKGKGKDTGNDIDEWELYDTSVDPLELNNIYNEEENNIVIEYLKRELSLYREKYKVNEF